MSPKGRALTDKAQAEQGTTKSMTGAKRPSFFMGFTGNIVVVGFVSLLTDISSEIAYPLLPLFLTVVLGAPASAVGIIEGIAESTASIVKLFSGWLSDKLGKRKALMVAGYSISNLVKPVLAVATSWPQVLAVRFADRLGKGVRNSPRDALIADSADPALRGKAFGFHRAMDTLGAAVGPLIAAAILYYAKGAPADRLRTAFLVSAIPGVVAVLVLAVFLTERRPHRKGARPSVSFKGLPASFRNFAAVAFIFSLGNSSDAFLILRARDAGLSLALIPLAYFTFNMVHAIFAIPMGALSDRIGRRRVIIAGYVIFALIYLGFALFAGAWTLWLLFAGYGLYYAATDGTQRAFIGDLVPNDLRATAVGVFNALTGIALLPASLAAGVLWQSFGPAAAFIYGSAFAFLAAIGFAFVR
jgi:MFS family permease